MGEMEVTTTLDSSETVIKAPTLCTARWTNNTMFLGVLSFSAHIVHKEKCG